MLTTLLTAIILMAAILSGRLQAGTMDEIRVLERGKTDRSASTREGLPVQQDESIAASPARFAQNTVPVWYPLSDGRKVDLRDWTIVVFMSSSCEHSHRFGPVIKQYSARTGISVFPFSMDGRGDATFPDVLPATPDVMVEYFQRGIPVSTPTTFLTHVNTMETWPLLQEAAELPQLVARLDDVFRLALDRQSGKRIPLPTSTGGPH